MKLHQILVIDDDKAILDCLRMNLLSTRQYRVVCCDNPIDAMRELEENEFSAVITDVDLPKMSGIELLNWVNKHRPELPVILFTGSSDTEILMDAIRLGAHEFLKKPFSMEDLNIRVKGAVEKYELLLQNKLYKDHLENLVSERTLELKEAQRQLEMSYLNTIRAMVNAMEVNDIYTRGHSERVTIIALTMGKYLELNPEEMHILRIGALLHDLGKIGVLSNVLKKDQTLTDYEYDIIKQHPITGAKIVEPIGLPEAVSKIILQHHEWHNGEGYPFGIKADEIDYFAGIVSVADSFDAMTSERPYRGKMNIKKALTEIKSKKGSQFDPQMVEALLACKVKIEAALSSQYSSELYFSIEK